MNNSFKVPCIGQGDCGRYTILSFNFETGNIEPTTASLRANGLIPFGFIFTLDHKDEGDGNKYDNANRKEYYNEISLKAFKAFEEKLQEKANKAGADYVLIDVLRNSAAMSYKWLIEARCQYFVKR